ncbi:MAG: RDD family protein [Propionibacteriaceae bacterium]
MHPLLAARARAYVRDAGTYLGVAAATVPFGLVLRQQGFGQSPGFLLAVSAVPPLVATLIAAGQESGVHHATWGKRRQSLVVTTMTGQPVSFGRALVRNVVKIGIPWQLGHTVAIGAAFGGFETGDTLTLAATAVTYPLIALMIVMVARRNGRGLHDRLAGTVVQRVRADAA